MKVEVIRLDGDTAVAPSGAELDNLAAVMGFQFVQRWDLHARQLEDGRYVCVHELLRHEQLLEHLGGSITLGMYLLNKESQGRHLVFDADNAPDWRRLRALATVLAEMGAPSYLEQSRRGGHLWLFFKNLLAGSEIRRLGQGLMLYFGLGSLELFPKQGQLSGGPGSLIRMPFGVHLKSGRRYGFYTLNGQPLAARLREQIRFLETPATVPFEIIEQFSAHGPVSRPHPRPSKASGKDGEEAPIHERIKAAMPVREFVGHYVALSPAGRGLCPFHDDHVDSFSVDDERNFWYCFACDIGGSIIDFWMNYRDREFGAAVSELASMLL